MCEQVKSSGCLEWASAAFYLFSMSVSSLFMVWALIAVAVMLPRTLSTATKWSAKEKATMAMEMVSSGMFMIWKRMATEASAPPATGMTTIDRILLITIKSRRVIQSMVMPV